MSYVLISAYDDREAINKPRVSERVKDSVTVGLDEMRGKLIIDAKHLLSKRDVKAVVGVDRYVEVRWRALKLRLKEALRRLHLKAEILDFSEAYKPREMVEALAEPFTTYDRYFERLYEGEIGGFLEGDGVKRLRDHVESCEGGNVMVYIGNGYINKYLEEFTILSFTWI